MIKGLTIYSAYEEAWILHKKGLSCGQQINASKTAPENQNTAILVPALSETERSLDRWRIPDIISHLEDTRTNSEIKFLYLTTARDHDPSALAEKKQTLPESTALNCYRASALWKWTWKISSSSGRKENSEKSNWNGGRSFYRRSRRRDSFSIL